MPVLRLATDANTAVCARRKRAVEQASTNAGIDDVAGSRFAIQKAIIRVRQPEHCRGLLALILNVGLGKCALRTRFQVLLQGRLRL